MDWPNLTEADANRLTEAIDLGEEAKWKLKIFRSGLIPLEDRWLQEAAHTAFDLFSDRERQVFSLRCRTHSFPLIASHLGISVSSVKTYWRRALSKCSRLWESSIHL